MEDGVLRINLIEQNIFKLIWEKCVLFVVWPHKDDDWALNGSPAINSIIYKRYSLEHLQGNEYWKGIERTEINVFSN